MSALGDVVGAYRGMSLVSCVHRQSMPELLDAEPPSPTEPRPDAAEA